MARQQGTIIALERTCDQWLRKAGNHWTSCQQMHGSAHRVICQHELVGHLRSYRRFLRSLTSEMLLQSPPVLQGKGRKDRSYRRFRTTPPSLAFSPAMTACCFTPADQIQQELTVHPKYSVCFPVFSREHFSFPEPSLFLAKGSDFTRLRINSAFRFLLSTPETLMRFKCPHSIQIPKVLGI